MKKFQQTFSSTQYTTQKSNITTLSFHMKSKHILHSPLTFTLSRYHPSPLIYSYCSHNLNHLLHFCIQTKCDLQLSYDNTSSHQNLILLHNHLPQPPSLNTSPDHLDHQHKAHRQRVFNVFIHHLPPNTTKRNLHFKLPCKFINSFTITYD